MRPLLRQSDGLRCRDYVTKCPANWLWVLVLSGHFVNNSHCRVLRNLLADVLKSRSFRSCHCSRPLQFRPILEHRRTDRPGAARQPWQGFHAGSNIWNNTIAATRYEVFFLPTRSDNFFLHYTSQLFTATPNPHKDPPPPSRPTPYRPFTKVISTVRLNYLSR